MKREEKREMLPKNRIPTHPGEILRDDFLVAGNITQARLADATKMSLQRINELVNGKRGITPDTAILLGKALNTSPEFWMNLQSTYDLAVTRAKHSADSVKPIID
jgi:addiction module HigA family antidote